MPEFPEINVQIQYLREHCIGWSIARFRATDRCRTLEIHGPPKRGRSLKQFFTESQIESVYQRGKLIVFVMTRGVMLSHLMYRGRWSIDDEPFTSNYNHHTRAPTEKTASFWIQNPDGRRLTFHAPQNQASMTLYPGESNLGQIERLASQGPEVLRTPLSAPEFPEWTTAELARKAATSRQPIATFLVDQKRIAGIGRTYARESLYAAKIDAELPANALESNQLKAIFRTVRRIMRLAINTKLDYSRVFKTLTKETRKTGKKKQTKKKRS